MAFEFDIRYSEEKKDGKTLIKWLADKKDQRWFPFSEEKEMHMMAKNWIGFSRYKASLTAIHKNQAVGIGTLYLMPYKKVAHHTMFYIIVGKAYRNKGVGTSLVKNLTNLAKKYFNLENIYCEVFEGCPLIPVLKSEGFIERARQEGYVKDQDEYLARIIMEKAL